VNREPTARRDPRLESLTFGRVEDVNSEYSICYDRQFGERARPACPHEPRTSRARRWARI